MRKHSDPYESTKYRDNIQLYPIKYRKKRNFYMERYKKKTVILFQLPMLKKGLEGGAYRNEHMFGKLENVKTIL
jgi:hypothetical protein